MCTGDVSKVLIGCRSCITAIVDLIVVSNGVHIRTDGTLHLAYLRWPCYWAKS